MQSIVIAMALILAISAAIALYVAYPHRGQRLPAAPWLGEAMRKGVDAVPRLPETAADPVPADPVPADRY